MNRRMLSVGLPVILVLLAFAAPVEAQHLVTERFEYAWLYTLPCEDGGFNASIESRLTGVQTFFTDKNGEPTDYLLHANWAGSITHSETGQSLRDQAAITTRGSLSGSVEQGVWFHFHVPGEGLVSISVGRIVVDEQGWVAFTAGQDPGQGQEWDIIVCEALANL